MRFEAIFVGATSSMMLAISPAAATVVQVTYSGAIAGGDGGYGNPAIDRLGLFGPAGANLLGDAYTAGYTFDTTQGTLSSSGCAPASASCPTQTNLLTGPPGGIPVVSESLTINGRSFSFGGPIYPINSAQLQATNNGAFLPSGIFAEVEANADLNSLRDELNIDNGSIPSSLTANYHYTVHPADGATTINSYFQADTGGRIDRFEFGINSVNLAVVSSAPEPASWTLMLIGVGFCGSVMRGDRRRRPGMGSHSPFGGPRST